MAGNVGDDRLGVAQTYGGDPLARPGHRLVRDISAKHVTMRPDARRQFEHRSAAPAANVERVLARLGRG